MFERTGYFMEFPPLVPLSTVRILLRKMISIETGAE